MEIYLMTELVLLGFASAFTLTYYFVIDRSGFMVIDVFMYLLGLGNVLGAIIAAGIYLIK